MTSPSHMPLRQAKKHTGLWVGGNHPQPRSSGQKQNSFNGSIARPEGRIDWPAILRTIWPAKPALELSLATGCTQRHAERVLAGTRGLSDLGVVALLRSHVGLAVWRALMAGSSETWWQKIVSDCEYAEAERRLAELKRQRDVFDRGR